jgi:hypothetical protein
MKALILIALALAGLAASTQAQSYSIDWSTVDGGGGTSTGGVYTVSGTIGQPDAGGPMTGGNYSLTGGFWALYAVPTPGAPTLKILNTGTNAVIVSWPSPSTGWTLQQNTNSVSSVNWSNVTSGIQDNGTVRYLVAGPMAGNRFYRLWKP